MPDEKKMPKVSAIIAARNEENFIAKCVESILAADYPPHLLEVVVVDGMSEDRTAEIVQEMGRRDGRIRLVPNPRRITPVAFNLGIQNSTGDILCIIAGHSVVERNYFRLTVQTLQDHPEAWCVGGMEITVSENLSGRAIAAAMATRVGTGNSRFRRGNYHGYVDTLMGSYWRWVFDRIGLFDEELIRNQDDELNFRVIKNGGRIWLNSDIVFSYYTRGTLRRLARQYYQYGFWRTRTIQKHGQPATLRQVAPVMFVCLWLALLIGWPMWHPLVYALAGLASCYGLALAAGTAEVVRRNEWKSSLLAPLVFIVLHFCYGLGTMGGFWTFYIRRHHGKIVDQPLSR